MTPTKRTIGSAITITDGRSIEATFYLLSIPGMRESIRKGMAEPLKKCSGKACW
ncbi:MAG: hypothetical protein V7609_1244 [Verrucomicrobiota bacterium]